MEKNKRTNKEWLKELERRKEYNKILKEDKIEVYEW